MHRAMFILLASATCYSQPGPIDLLFDGGNTAVVRGLDVSGNLAVWSSDGIIYGKDIHSDSPYFVICNDPGEQMYPKTDGRYVAWVSNKTDGNFTELFDEIKCFDVLNSKQRLIAGYSASYGYYRPQIDCGKIVYNVADRHTYDRTARCFDVVANSSLPLAIPPYALMRISDDRIAYTVDYYSLYLYDLRDKNTRLIDREGHHISYSIGESYVIWWSSDDRCLYAHDIFTKRKITLDCPDITNAIGLMDVSGSIAIWEEDGLNRYDIPYGIKSSITADGAEAFAISANVVIWNNGRQIYKAIIDTVPCTHRPLMDFSGDCRVNLIDLAIFLDDWLDCGLAIPEACQN